MCEGSNAKTFGGQAPAGTRAATAGKSLWGKRPDPSSSFRVQLPVRALVQESASTRLGTGSGGSQPFLRAHGLSWSSRWTKTHRFGRNSAKKSYVG